MSATDPNRLAIRLARCHRPLEILVLSYCYHGSVDETLVLDGPDGLGPRAARQYRTPWTPPNDPGRDLERCGGAGGGTRIRGRRGRPAEPALTNVGIVPPEAGFLDRVARAGPPGTARC